MWEIVTGPAATPLTVTVWAVAQLSVVNVKASLTVATAVSELPGVTVTFSVGWVANVTS